MLSVALLCSLLRFPMFSSLGLFGNLACPTGPQCARSNCLYSHRTSLPPPHTLNIPIQHSKETPRPTAASIPAKRPAAPSPARAADPSSSHSGSVAVTEPPRKLQKLGVTQKKVSATSTSYTSVILSIALQIASPDAEIILQTDWCANTQN